MTLTDSVVESLSAAFASAEGFDQPYRHWIVADVFPQALANELAQLNFPHVDLAGVSGKRELHNDQRQYFAGQTNDRESACAAVAGAFQSPAVVAQIERVTGAQLAGSYVRLEYAQDTDGFWLEPHTDLGVKIFTLLIYLDGGAGQGGLGTDIYADARTWAKRTPFTTNSALMFVPGQSTWHGLAPRPILGVRRSVIMNYVTDDWRARDQLAFPLTPVRAT